jgi:hypothetical protein
MDETWLLGGSQTRLPRHDWVLWRVSGTWFGVAAAWAAVAAAPSANLAWVIVGAALAACSAAAGVWHYLRTRRDPELARRRALLTALRALPAHGPWLNNGQDTLITYFTLGLPLLRMVAVVHYSAADVRTLLEDEQVHAVAQVWQMYPSEPGVRHSMQEAAFTADPGGDIAMNLKPPGIRQSRKGQRAARAAGLLYATADEIDALITMLQGSEPESTQDVAER